MLCEQLWRINHTALLQPSLDSTEKPSVSENTYHTLSVDVTLARMIVTLALETVSSEQNPTDPIEAGNTVLKRHTHTAGLET